MIKKNIKYTDAIIFLNEIVFLSFKLTNKNFLPSLLLPWWSVIGMQVSLGSLTIFS